MKSRRALAVLSLLVAAGLVQLIAGVPVVSAQVQYVTVSKGDINLGMTTSITVTAPASGLYTVVVVQPDSSKVQLDYSFTAAGQVHSENFGNSTLGFKTAVSQVGTYNVFLEKGGQVVSSASFYATNKLNVSIDFVNGGVCNYIAYAPRGVKIFPRFYITYASSGAPLNKSSKVSVTFTVPDNTTLAASYHRPTVEAPVSYGFYIGKFYPNWNYSAVGPWSLTAFISDGLGNSDTYQYIGPAFVVSPSQLAMSVRLIDSGTSKAVGGFYEGQLITINATITYPTNPEPVPGFVAPLDSAQRGGSVSALVGWGFYNATSGNFGGSQSPGGLIASVTMAYAGSNGTWLGNFKVPSLPSIPQGATYEVVVTSSDSASPPNTGLAVADVGPASFAPGSTTVTSTATYTTTGTQTVTGTSATTPTVTAPTGVELSPTVALLTAVGTLIVGVIVGAIVKKTA